ncbi:MAG: bacterioferritin [Bacteroidetes bacterium]|nr:bacterioferritin [Bacteroidota bacterium]
MKGNEKLMKTLNDLLADELTAISQYMVHSEMCESWGYDKLHKAIEHQAKEEMQHAEWLIGRILFLEGMPTMSKLNQIRIGKDVPEIVGKDEEAEAGAVQAYNAAITLAGEVGDGSTADLLTTIVKMEEEHMDWGKKQRIQIAQMGLQTYLSLQTGGAA